MAKCYRRDGKSILIHPDYFKLRKPLESKPLSEHVNEMNNY